ncbi:MAG: hypothetical protein QFB87_05180 [Patescibacteria group bacterium]|nr:hypothetical protein [Patescibacteria group bacterium]
MSVGLRAGSDGISGAVQLGGADAALFNSGGFSAKIQSFTATMATNILTGVFAPAVSDFRNTTANAGTPNTLVIPSLTLAIPATSNLGALVSGGLNKLVWVVVNNAGTPVIAVMNNLAGFNFDEKGFISPTTVGSSSNTANTFYSASAVGTNLPYRVVGECDVAFTTGTGWSNPVITQGAGGQASNGLVSGLINGSLLTVDTPLNVGQTAYYDVSGVTSLALKIATASNQEYEISWSESAAPATSSNSWVLNLNNSTYGTTISNFQIYANSGNATITGTINTQSNFSLGINSVGAIYSFTARVKTNTTRKQVWAESRGSQVTAGFFGIVHGVSTDLTTVWTSLGTISFVDSATGRVTVRRIS